MSGFRFDHEPRPEELIAEIYRQYSQLREAGKRPRGVRLPHAYVRRLRVYRFLSGELADPAADYLGSHEIFGLDFFTGEENCVDVIE